MHPFLFICHLYHQFQQGGILGTFETCLSIEISVRTDNSSLCKRWVSIQVFVCLIFRFSKRLANKTFVRRSFLHSIWAEESRVSCTEEAVRTGSNGALRRRPLRTRLRFHVPSRGRHFWISQATLVELDAFGRFKILFKIDFFILFIGEEGKNSDADLLFSRLTTRVVTFWFISDIAARSSFS